MRKMRGRQVFAAVTAALFVLLLFLTQGATLHHTGHYCEEVACSVCTTLRNTKDKLAAATAANTSSAFLPVLILGTVLLACVTLQVCSPIALKTRCDQ